MASTRVVSYMESMLVRLVTLLSTLLRSNRGRGPVWREECKVGRVVFAGKRSLRSNRPTASSSEVFECFWAEDTRLGYFKALVAWKMQSLRVFWDGGGLEMMPTQVSKNKNLKRWYKVVKYETSEMTDWLVTMFVKICLQHWFYLYSDFQSLLSSPRRTQ